MLRLAAIVLLLLSALPPAPARAETQVSVSVSVGGAVVVGGGVLLWSVSTGATSSRRLEVGSGTGPHALIEHDRRGLHIGIPDLDAPPTFGHAAWGVVLPLLRLRW